MAAQQSLFPSRPDAPRNRRPLLPPHATAEDMARKREVSLYLLPASPRGKGWACRPESTPASSLESFLRHIDRPASDLQVAQGADAEDIELRLTEEAARGGPLHILAIITGVTLDEARKALALLRAA